MSKVLKLFFVVAAVCWTSSLIALASQFRFKFHDVDPVFQPYVTDFYNLLHKTCPSKEKYNVNYYTIEFANSPDPNEWVGVCRPGVNGYTIDIDRDFWKRMRSAAVKQELLFHELSHCVIYRAHVDDIDNYMYPSLADVFNKDVLIKQTVKNMQDYCNE